MNSEFGENVVVGVGSVLNLDSVAIVLGTLDMSSAVTLRYVDIGDIGVSEIFEGVDVYAWLNMVDSVMVEDVSDDVIVGSSKVVSVVGIESPCDRPSEVVADTIVLGEVVVDVVSVIEEFVEITSVAIGIMVDWGVGSKVISSVVAFSFVLFILAVGAIIGELCVFEV